MNKLNETLKFYYNKLLAVVNITLDNIVKTVEVTLSKVPKAIEDLYNNIIANLNIDSAIIIVLVYTLMKHAAIILADPFKLVAILAALAYIAKKK